VLEQNVSLSSITATLIVSIQINILMIKCNKCAIMMVFLDLVNGIDFKHRKGVLLSYMLSCVNNAAGLKHHLKT